VAGNLRNHSALLTGEQVDQLRRDAGLAPQTEWGRLIAATAAGQWAAARREHLRLPPHRLARTP